MKNRFTKTILVSLIISMIPMLSGFCIFQFNLSQPFKINTAQAATIDTSNNNSTDNIANNTGSCGGGQQTESIPTQTSTPTLINHGNINSLLPCCIDGSHSGISSIIQSIESSPSVPAIIFSEKTPVLPEPQILFVGNQNISPPTLSIIKTVVLRL